MARASKVQKTYRALLRGECPLGFWRQPGEVFETDAPKARWMEEVPANKE